MSYISSSRTSQRGLGIISLIFSLAIIGFIAVEAFRCVPVLNEYQAIKKSLAQIEASGETNQSAARKSFDKMAEIDRIESLKGADITFTSSAKGLESHFEYEARVPLFANVSLAFAFSK